MVFIFLAGCQSAAESRFLGPPAVPTVRNLVRGERPDDHTVLFRTHHAEQASSSDAKCFYCHLGLSGSNVDSCAECHTTTRPRDHTARWRGPEHGRTVALDPSRCTTCHEADECSSCHSVPPPSHSPLILFRTRHAPLASRNPRSCLTCHGFETTCVECHSLDYTRKR